MACNSPSRAPIYYPAECGLTEPATAMPSAPVPPVVIMIRGCVPKLLAAMALGAYVRIQPPMPTHWCTSTIPPHHTYGTSGARRGLAVSTASMLVWRWETGRKQAAAAGEVIVRGCRRAKQVVNRPQKEKGGCVLCDTHGMVWMPPRK